MSHSYSFGGNGSAMVRTSSNFTMSGGEHFVECDTDSGSLTVKLSLTRPHLSRHEIWLGSQPVGTATIDPQWQTVHGASLVLSTANEGRVLTWIQPDPQAGGYWRCRVA